MHMTEEGLTLIKEFEGFRAKAYRCPAGVWTIGYGHTASAGPPEVSAGMTLSEADAARILVRDVERFADGVRQALSATVTPEQFSALVSFAYNVGLGAFGKSSVLAACNCGDLAAVPRRLQLWNKAGGRVLPGLVRRRAAEAALFIGAAHDVPPPSSGTVKPSSGKAITDSTTAGAAAVVVAAGGTAAVAAGQGGSLAWPVTIILLIAIAAAGLWIIRERRRMSKEDGL